MEQWKLSVATGVGIIILALAFSIVTKNLSIWMVLVIALGIADILIGLYRKKEGI